jgi:hypothetical protein
MNWTEMLASEIDTTYRATEGLVRMVDDDRLDWRPATGSNWMSTGQLLEHLTTACGFCCKGFTTGEWGMPEGASADEMLPSAEKLPSARSVAETLSKLAADKRTALDMLGKAGEKDLAGRKVAAPWDPTEKPLGRQFLMSVQHLAQHKGQLFYYLKLQGKPVHTGDLWGM